jgi:prepilin-type N-terminal cleavage/methylation domain-containing protein
MSRPRHVDDGFTIIEIMMVVGIFGLLLGAAVMGFRNIARSDLRSAASRTAAAMRFSFDRATMTGNYIRLAINIDKGEIWPEASEDKVTLRAGGEQHTGGDSKDPADDKPALKKSAPKAPLMPFLTPPTKPGEEGKEGEASASAPGIDTKQLTAEWEADKAPVERPRPRFQPLKGAGTKRIKLAPGVLVTAVITPRQPETAEKGTAYVYFFPQGHAEPAIIHFADRHDEYYSVVLHPLTGQARVYPCLYKVPSDFDVSDDKRKSVGKDACASKGGI